MERNLDLLERWVRLLATGFGLLVITLPLLRVWRIRRAPRGRKSGSYSLLNRWPAIFVLAVIYVTFGILLWKPIPVTFPPSIHLVLILAGTVLYFSGVILYAWGFNTLGSMFGVSSAMGAELYEDQELVQVGPYAFVRHPMYLGVIVVAIGAFLIFRTWAMVFYTPTAFIVIVRARREEKLLAAEFGEAWKEYRDRVPGWIPRVINRTVNAS
jgi:protein-S-isoprenylcysteine O-methyltransferase Ste14